MKNRKATLISIIILLIIFLPLTTLGTITHFKNAPQKEKNKNYEFKQDGKLNFYNGNKLLGTYTCEHFDEYCDYAIAKVTSEYSLEEYIPENLTKLNLINNQYAFLYDTTTMNLQNAEVILYDILNNKVLAIYKEVKNYGVGLENNRYIVKDKNDLWGVIELNDSLTTKIPFNYDYIGITKPNDANPEKITSNRFAVKKEEEWQIIASENQVLSVSFPEEIVSYNEEYIILKGENYMKYVDYEGASPLSNPLKYIAYYEQYLEVIDDKNTFYLYDEATKEKISKDYIVTERSDINITKEGKTIIIKRKENIVETIPIN